MAPANRDESRPAPSEEVPPQEHDHDAQVAHQTEEPVAEHMEVSERLTEKTESLRKRRTGN